jgi:hypothetical protein
MVKFDRGYEENGDGIKSTSTLKKGRPTQPVKIVEKIKYVTLPPQIIYRDKIIKEKSEEVAKEVEKENIPPNQPKNIIKTEIKTRKVIDFKEIEEKRNLKISNWNKYQKINSIKLKIEKLQKQLIEVENNNPATKYDGRENSRCDIQNKLEDKENGSGN